MTRNITSKSVDKFVEDIHDNRFSSHLFASLVANENRVVNERFMQIILNYLQMLADQHARGVDYFGLQDLQSMAYKMYVSYLEAGGTGESLNLLDLNRFDT